MFQRKRGTWSNAKIALSFESSQLQEGYLIIRSLKNSINPKPESTRAAVILMSQQDRLVTDPSGRDSAPRVRRGGLLSDPAVRHVARLI